MTDPLIALGGGILFLLLIWGVFRPKKGLLARWQLSQQKTAQVLREDALKHIYRCTDESRCATLESIAGALDIAIDQAASVVADLEQRFLLHHEQGNLALTAAGDEAALHIIRAHRLWERYLSDETGYGATEWHAQADRIEHDLTPIGADKLAAQLGNPGFDPHGDPIPTTSGRLGKHGGVALQQFAAGDVLRITHLEDEPENVFAQLVAENLHPGMVARISEVSVERVVFWTNGNEHILAPIVAANISAIPIAPEQQKDVSSGLRLDEIDPGEQVEVAGLSPACRGSERRRFLDLGLVAGTLVSAEFVSPSGEPTAYKIRGALIALRSEQAHKINVRRLAT